MTPSPAGGATRQGISASEHADDVVHLLASSGGEREQLRAEQGRPMSNCPRRNLPRPMQRAASAQLATLAAPSVILNTSSLMAAAMAALGVRLGWVVPLTGPVAVWRCAAAATGIQRPQQKHTAARPRPCATWASRSKSGGVQAGVGRETRHLASQRLAPSAVALPSWHQLHRTSAHKALKQPLSKYMSFCTKMLTKRAQSRLMLQPAAQQHCTSIAEA